MENKLKLKFSRMFRSSLDSCRSKSISDVSTVEQPFFFPENGHHHRQLIQLFSPKPPPPSRPFPSFCKPKSINKNTHLITTNRAMAISDRQNGGHFKARHEGLTLTSQGSLPSLPANTMFNDCNPRVPKHRRHRNKSRKTRQKNNDKFDAFFSSVATNYYGWCSSEDEKQITSKFDDETTFFSSKSMSSDSSVSFRAAAKNNVAATLKSTTKEHSGDSDDENELTNICSPVDAKVKDSVAVIKRSSDPYTDFRTSMVEMIVEKQIFGSQDLENLLQCFLSLNSITHHRVIIEVFTEIWETLFSDWN